MCNEQWWFRGTLQFYCTVIRLCIDKITLFIIPFNPNKITDLLLFVPINFKLPLYEAYQFALSINEEAMTSTILLLWEFVYFIIFLSFGLCSWSKWVSFLQTAPVHVMSWAVYRNVAILFLLIIIIMILLIIFITLGLCLFKSTHSVKLK